MDAKILLVDDDISVRQSIARLLTKEGYDVVSAANGAQALSIIDNEPVALALLDLNLPEKSGWEIFQQLAFKEPLLPIIIITASPHQLFRALAAGAAALLEKPMDFLQLLQTVRDLLAEPEKMRLARTNGKSAQFHYLPSQAA